MSDRLPNTIDEAQYIAISTGGPATRFASPPVDFFTQVTSSWVFQTPDLGSRRNRAAGEQLSTTSVTTAAPVISGWHSMTMD